MEKKSCVAALIMKDTPLQTPVKSSGLAPLVKKHLLAALAKLVPQWQAEPAANWKRITRPTGVDSCSITIEPYQGLNSSINFRQKVVGTETIQLLEKIVREQQPELLGYVIPEHTNGGRQIEDCFQLCMCLAKEIVRRINSSSSLEAAISSVVADLEKLLITEIAECQVLTVLNGLKLPDEVDRIDLDEGLYLRALTNEEIIELASNDIYSNHGYEFSPLSVNIALMSKRNIAIKLSQDNKGHSAAPAKPLLYREQVNNVLETIHILKSGYVNRIVSFITVHPPILPNMNGTSHDSSAPPVVNPCRRVMKLSQEDIDKFAQLYKALVATQRNEVKIAAARLVDAESRTSPVDALLDAVIGLEALLNPNDYSELAFRVALNYAFLSSTVDRRDRYDNIRDVQKTRNDIVHAGLNLKSKAKDVRRLHEHTKLAKECLRDALTRFLTDESLMGNKKLDAEFWLDRVLPPDTASTVAL